MKVSRKVKNTEVVSRSLKRNEELKKSEEKVSKSLEKSEEEWRCLKNEDVSKRLKKFQKVSKSLKKSFPQGLFYFINFTKISLNKRSRPWSLRIRAHEDTHITWTRLKNDHSLLSHKNTHLTLIRLKNEHTHIASASPGNEHILLSLRSITNENTHLSSSTLTPSKHTENEMSSWGVIIINDSSTRLKMHDWG